LPLWTRPQQPVVLNEAQHTVATPAAPRFDQLTLSRSRFHAFILETWLACVYCYVSWRFLVRCSSAVSSGTFQAERPQPHTSKACTSSSESTATKPKSYLANESVSCLGVRDHRRRGPCALGICDNRRPASLHCCHGRVGGAKIYADHLQQRAIYQ
jgi:hypothetical protein